MWRSRFQLYLRCSTRSSPGVGQVAAFCLSGRPCSVCSMSRTMLREDYARFEGPGGSSGRTCAAGAVDGRRRRRFAGRSAYGALASSQELVRPQELGSLQDGGATGGRVAACEAAGGGVVGWEVAGRHVEHDTTSKIDFNPLSAIGTELSHLYGFTFFSSRRSASRLSFGEKWPATIQVNVDCGPRRRLAPSFRAFWGWMSDRVAEKDVKSPGKSAETVASVDRMSLGLQELSVSTTDCCRSRSFLDLDSKTSHPSPIDPNGHLVPVPALLTSVLPLLRYCITAFTACFDYCFHFSFAGPELRSSPTLQLRSYIRCGTGSVARAGRSSRGPLSAVPVRTRGCTRSRLTTRFVSFEDPPAQAGRVSRIGSNVCLSLTSPLLRIGDPSPYATLSGGSLVDPTILRSYPLPRATRYQPQHAPEHLVAPDTSLANAQTTPPKTQKSTPQPQKLQKPPICRTFTSIPAA